MSEVALSLEARALRAAEEVRRLEGVVVGPREGKEKLAGECGRAGVRPPAQECIRRRTWFRVLPLVRGGGIVCGGGGVP